MPSRDLSAELQEVKDLLVEAITGTAGLVEALHSTINTLGGVLGQPGRTHGLTRLVYKSITGITGLVSSGIDATLKLFGPVLSEAAPSPTRQALVAALNGVLGDRLAERRSPFAIPMEIRLRGQALSGEALAEALNGSTNRAVLLVHGAAAGDLQWRRRGHDHGAALAEDLGTVPLYVSYNSGLHVSENGRALAHLLEELTHALDDTFELSILGHSMGGLVARGACYYGSLSGHGWLTRVKNLVFMGTPHHGALLERGGNLLDVLLEVSPYSAPFSRLGKLRSSGITDLRYGNIVDEDWRDVDRFTPTGDHRTNVSLPENSRCYAMAATTGKQPGKLNDNLIGDGLVTLKSALGLHKYPERNLMVPVENRWIGRSMGHLDLLSHPEVYRQLKTWLTPLQPDESC